MSIPRKFRLKDKLHKFHQWICWHSWLVISRRERSPDYNMGMVIVWCPCCNKFDQCDL